jgi:hypothetical protein
MEREISRQTSLKIEADIRDWILTRLSKAHPAFNNLPPCPFAREALLANKVQLKPLRFPAFECVQNEISQFEDSNIDVLVLFDELNQLSKTQIESLVQTIREQYAAKNYWLMYDHPDVEEHVADFDVSFNKTPLLFLQKLDNLNEKATELEQRGYYKNWSSDYFQDVVGRRKGLAPRS